MPTALGREYIAILSTNERGPIERRPATTRREAFATARILLDVAERGAWNQGEVVAAPEQFERWYARHRGAPLGQTSKRQHVPGRDRRFTRRAPTALGPSSIWVASYDRQCVRIKPQIVPMAVGGVGVVNLPDVIIDIEFDFAPMCIALVAQHGLDARPLFGTGGPVREYLSGEQDTRCEDQIRFV
jgi:hypothetical protein